MYQKTRGAIAQRHAKGVIAAGHPKTAAAGQAMFTLGGNAFDAAVAAILAAFVAEPALTSPAGGGFLLAHTQEKRNLLFDFFPQTPRYKKTISELDFYPVDVDFGDAIQTFHIGLGSIAVPGNIAGICKVHKMLGKLPFQEVVQPAIEYAKKGIEVNYFQGLIFQLLRPIFAAQPESKKIYAPQGKMLSQGDKIVMPDLANTLQELVTQGSRLFYEGEIAQQLVNDCQNRGGHLSLEDLQNYQVIIREPLQIDYRGHEFLTNPPPSSGGMLIAFALKLLSQIDLTKIAIGSAQYYQLMTQVMQLTNAARNNSYNEKIYQENIREEFLSTEHLQSYQQTLAQTINKLGSTTHISVMDNEGNAASVTTSNGEGSSYIIPGTGVMVNNMLGEADLNPLGFHKWQCNQRISSMMSPTMILKQGKPEIVLGSGGSNRIRTAILQVIINLIDFNLSVTEAVNSPRLHWEEGILNIEPPYDLEAVNHTDLLNLTERVLWQQQSMFFGGVNTVTRNADGVMSGAGDPRRGGVVLVS